MKAFLRYLTTAFAGTAALATISCGGGDDAGTTGGSGGLGGTGGTEAGIDPNANPDGDCMTNGEELANGTDPELADTDGDGQDDCQEVACKSNPTDSAKRCYECGWSHGDPGNLTSTGANEGDVIENLPLIDQCGETVPIWDFAGEYHILFMTAVW